MREYDLIAEWYAGQRTDDTAVPEVASLAASIPRGSRVLDFGCGNGIPLTRVLIDAGHRVVGLDSSREMLARFRRNCPGAAAVRGLIQACPFADATFDAAISYGAIFHLDRADVLRMYEGVARLLRPGALLMFSAPDERHEHGITGDMNGVTFHYFSPLGIEELTETWHGHGLTILDRHTDKGDNTYFLARKCA